MTLTVPITVKLKPDVAKSVERHATSPAFKGKLSPAAANLIERGLRPFNLEAMASEELVALRMAVVMELNERSAKPSPTSEK